MLTSQIDFKSLTFPDLQPAVCDQDAMDHDVFCKYRMSSSKKKTFQDQNACIALNDAAVENSAACCADVLDEGATGQDFCKKYLPGSTQSASDGLYDPERVLRSKAPPPPPKRFYKTCWRSISFRLLHRWTQAARLSFKSASSSI